MNGRNSDEIAADQVLSVTEGIEIQKRIAESSPAKQWHWMGNYGDVYGPVQVANGAGISAGEMLVQIMGNGLVASWMFY